MGISICKTLSTDAVQSSVGTIPDTTDSFVDPVQFKIIQNLWNSSEYKFSEYMCNRRTVTDRNLRTDELALLISNEAFHMAYVYLTLVGNWDIDYEIVLHARPGFLKTISVPNVQIATYVIYNWYIYHVLSTHQGPVSWYVPGKSVFAMLRYEMLEDPVFTYDTVEKFLSANMKGYTVDSIVDLIMSSEPVRIGAFRALRFVINIQWYKFDYIQYTPYLRRLHAIKKFIVPTDLSLEKYFKHPDFIEFVAEIYPSGIDSIIHRVDWNTDLPNIDKIIPLISENTFKYIIKHVWRTDKRAQMIAARSVKSFDQL